MQVIYRESVVTLIRSLEVLDKIFMMYAWMMAMHSLSKTQKWESKKFWNRLRLDNSVSRVTSMRVYAIFRVYTWHIVFASVPLHEGELAQRSFCISRSPHPLPRPLSHSSFPVSEFAVPRVSVIVLRYIRGRLLRTAPCHGFGRKRYYFSQFAKQMLPIVKPPRRHRCRCRRTGRFVARGLFSRLVSDSRRHCDILPPFCAAERIFLHTNSCNREIFMPVYEPKYARGWEGVCARAPVRKREKEKPMYRIRKLVLTRDFLNNLMNNYFKDIREIFSS